MKNNLELKDFMDGKTDAASIKKKYLKEVDKKEKKQK